MMDLLDRLKLARDDFDQQEKLYNTLVLGLRFYVGIAALLGGWSLSLLRVQALEASWDVAMLFVTGATFWIVLLCVLYQLFMLMKGDHWTLPRTLDQYLAWERARLQQLHAPNIDTGDKTPEQFAEDEMMHQMIGAFADSACVNRTANLARQARITKTGKFLLLAVIALGVQGAARIIYEQRHGKQSEQSTEATAATTAAPGAGRHDQPK